MSPNLLFSATQFHLSHLPQLLAYIVSFFLLSPSSPSFSPIFHSPPLLLLHHLLMGWMLCQEFLQTLFNKGPT